MLPAMALPGSPSMPAVMTSLGLITSNAARTQSEDSWLSGPGPGTNPARKIRSMVSSLRHPKNLVCLSGFSPIHASSASDSSESVAPESSACRGASTPGGAVMFVASGVGELVGVALGAAVGLSVGVSVETGRQWTPVLPSALVWRSGPGSPGLVLGRSRLSVSPGLTG